jgi:GNAT superfamily N-acetyltransferase
VFNASVITAMTSADLADVLAGSPWLAQVVPGSSGPTGWVARNATGAVVGAAVDLPGRLGDAAVGAWSASSATTLDELYGVAAAAWVQAGVLTHRVLLPSGDPLEPTLIDLGFGHQQAFASAPLTALAPLRRDADVDVRAATEDDLPVLTTLVPLVARHQGGSPMFAPRAPEFYTQLPASLAKVVDDPASRVLVATEGTTVVGFMVLEHDGPVVEIVLAGTVAEQRGRGVGRALLMGARAWAVDRRATHLTADWRTTSAVSARFWLSAGLVPDTYRWARTIDPTPT